MQILIFVIITIYLIIGCASTTTNRHKEDFHYKLGLAYLNEANYQLALVEFKKAVIINPNNKDTLQNIGLIHLQFDDIEEAKNSFEKAIFIDPKFSDAYNNLGVLYIRLNQYNSAIDSFKKALENPVYESPERAFSNLGMAYLKIGQFDLSIDVFKKAIKRSPFLPTPYRGLAICYYKTKQNLLAKEALTNGVILDPIYNGDIKKFIEDVKQQLQLFKDKENLETYLDILKYQP